ncbi:hypothetical protein Ahy_B04g072671 [Arachis hypogaea]|uniref:Aminotransferase-like plant mobile domain-containing protein n=1 Tax=Arachis hypogaea TaxID=3818 RepID=A0A444ZNH3_ARAHY|nr:hypothetical protein Ahy_B04g072671 [Arachis hypogaea]
MPLDDQIILYLEITGLYHPGCLTDFDKFIEGGRLAWTWFEELLGVLPPVNSIGMYTVKYNWIQETFNELPPDADKETVRRYAWAYIMILLST